MDNEPRQEFRIIDNISAVYDTLKSPYGNYIFELTDEQLEALRCGKTLCHIKEYGIFITRATEAGTITEARSVGTQGGDEPLQD